MIILLAVAWYLAISCLFMGTTRTPRRILASLLWPAALVMAWRRR